MARSIKIDNADKKRFERQETKRKENTRSKRKYYLIVCEGEKTEPNYFKAMKRDLPKGTIEHVDIEGTGTSCLKIISETIKIRKRYEKVNNRKYDRVWTVFDKDSFPNDQFDNAIHKGSSKNINCAWSNEAFELWYCLHFQFVNHGMSRKDYSSFIEREVIRITGLDFVYKKNDPNMYKLLEKIGDKNKAIKWAKMLDEKFTDEKFSLQNPNTKMYKLICELFDYEDSQCKYAYSFSLGQNK